MQESTVYRSIAIEAEVRKQREIAINFLRDGFPVEAVAHGTGLSIEEVQQLQQQLKNMVSLDLPLGLEKFRSRFATTVEPYIDIQTRSTRKTTLWQSKFAGFPYLPKSFEYPVTPEGDPLHLLAQINFDEVPNLEGYPTTGILQFYIARDEMYGLNYENPTNQTKFRVLYFPEVDLNKNNLITNFDFLPILWDYDDGGILLPFLVSPSYSPHRDDCFALSFDMKYAPISEFDYRFEKLIGDEIWDVFEANDRALSDEYREKFAEGHRIGGYPHFTQADFREFLPENEEPYVLLLQIDCDPGWKISIQWGDMGVCNFWIKPSALKNLDFSEVLYNWDCS